MGWFGLSNKGLPEKQAPFLRDRALTMVGSAISAAPDSNELGERKSFNFLTKERCVVPEE
jgi:hypothetical protein